MPFNSLKRSGLGISNDSEPRIGGQSFIPETLDKVRELVALREEKGYHYLIEVRWRVNGETAKLCAAAGVNVAVAGSYANDTS